MTMLRYNVEKAVTSQVQVRLFGRTKEKQKFSQSFYVNYKLEDFFLLDVMNSVYVEIIATETLCNVL